MIRKLTMGAGAIAAAGLGYLGLSTYTGPGPRDVTPAQEASLDEDSSDEICLKADLPFVKGDQTGCISKAEITSWRVEPFMDDQARPRSVKMSHPTDATQPSATVRDCKGFNEYRYEGWFAATSAEMRREAYFIRNCGVIEMLLNAREAQQNYFGDEGITRSGLTAIAESGIFTFGEEASPLGEITIDRDGPNWRLNQDDQMIVLEEIAVLDFDSDGIAEILLFVFAGPERGTARIGEIAVVEKDSPDAEITLVPIDFSRKRG